jgi:sugar phosphate isomerase/epimerase
MNIITWTPRLALAILLLLAFMMSESKTDKSPVRIGYCGMIKDIDQVKAAGFDYIELRTTEITALSDTEFASLQEKLKHIGLPVLATYLFIPANIKLTGPAINKEEQMAYVRKALDRVSQLGARIVAFGSGPARQYPDGFSKDEAFRQFVDFCQRIGPEARLRHLIIAVEPLRPQESNLINSTADGLDLIAAVNDPNIQLNLDYYHFEMNKENPAIILKAAEHIRHIHFANPTGRVFPLHAGEYDYRAFFESLRQIKYQGELSLEAGTKDFAAEAPQSVRFIRSELDHASR